MVIYGYIWVYMGIYGSNLRGRIFLQKVVIFFLSLKAHYGQVFDPSDKSFEFLSLSGVGTPKM